jgi:hypothetical protein
VNGETRKSANAWRECSSRRTLLRAPNRTALGEIASQVTPYIRIEVTDPPRQRENSAHYAGGDRDDAERKEDERGTLCAIDGGRGGAGS